MCESDVYVFVSKCCARIFRVLQQQQQQQIVRFNLSLDLQGDQLPAAAGMPCDGVSWEARVAIK